MAFRLGLQTALHRGALLCLGHERREMVTYMALLAFFIPYRCNDCLRKDHLSTLVVGYLQINTGVVKMKQGILGKISRLGFFTF